MQYVILVIVCLFVFIGATIALIAYSISAPLYLQIMLVIWVVVLMLTFILAKKQSTSFAVGIIATLIYSFAFAYWYGEDVLQGDYNDGGAGDTVGMFSVAFFSAVPICCLAVIIRGKIDGIREKKKETQINKIKQEINKLENEINELEERLNNRYAIITLLSLMNMCGADITNIQDNPEVNNISQLICKIDSKKSDIKKMSSELRRIK